MENKDNCSKDSKRKDNRVNERKKINRQFMRYISGYIEVWNKAGNKNLILIDVSSLSS